MSKPEIVLNRSEIGRLLKGEEVESMLSSYAGRVEAQAGSGYSSRLHNTGQRLAANIYADTKEAESDNFKNNTLLKAIGTKL